MCAPRKALVPLIIAGGLAVATGGISIGATTATTASTASTVVPASVAGMEAAIVGSSIAPTTTLGSLSSALKVGLKYANTAAPLIGSAGLIYSGQIQKGILEQQAAFSEFQAGQEEETYQIRKDQRKRQLAIALGKQRALYGTSGVAIENTPTEILQSTASSFAFDQYVDRYQTASRMTSANLSASNLKTSASQAELGGLLNAELALARRGIA